ncbi:MAG: class I SAM-dependent methyltransferase [Cyanobacteriota bacterium]|nr:class I SAM-dependent methyltransferase [Cyanobacteriota bacterium]
MWNHNAHFHRYLLRQLPEQVHRILDVGCGLGVFARKLAERAEFVDAIDVDSVVLTEASSRNIAPNIHSQQAGFLETDFPKASYDAIAFIASLHHMDLEMALEKAKVLLRPSGKLLVLGLYREETPIDYLYSAISVPLNLIYLNGHRTSTPSPTTPISTLSPRLSLEQIEAVAKTLIPGFRLQRHLLWRYSLIWQKH